MGKLEFKNLSHKAADLIEEKIIKMEIEQGERLLEAKLADSLDVSQGTIREALRLLEKKGLVSINIRRGTVVTELTREYVISLYDILTELYGLLAHKSMEKFSMENVQVMFKIFEGIDSAAKANDVEAYYDGIFNFAAAALDITGDSLLREIIMGLWPNKKRIEYKTLMQRKKNLVDNARYFQQLREALIKQDRESVVSIMREYTQNEKKSALLLFPGENH